MYQPPYHANQWDTGYCMCLVVSSDPPDLCINLCTLNTGCPDEYDAFLGILQGLIREVIAEDE